MPPVRVKYVVSFSSQDTRHTVENLVTGSGSWLSSTTDKSGRLQADLQLEKAITISFLDLGNSGSVTISVEVGRSSWPTSQKLVTLLPTVALMNPVEWRSQKNMTAVRMFKQSDFNTEAAKEKWDRVRVVCTQPFRKDVQFGLSLFRLHANTEIVNSVEEPAVRIIKDDTQKHVVPNSKKEELVSRMNLPAVQKKKMSQSIGWLENKIVTNGEELESGPPCNPFTSPVSRAARLVVMAAKPQSKQEKFDEKANLECEALDFLIGLNLTIADINTLKVSGVRRFFEQNRQKELSLEEKKIFKDIALDFAKERLKRLEMQQEKLPLKGSAKSISQHQSDASVKTSGKITNDSRGIKNKSKEKLQPRHFNNVQEERKQGPQKFTFKHIGSPAISKKSIVSTPHNVSLSRQKLREEDDLQFQSSSGSTRNNVALGDSKVTTPKRSRFGKTKNNAQGTKENVPVSIDGWLTKSKRIKEDFSALNSPTKKETSTSNNCEIFKTNTRNDDSSEGGFLIDPTPYIIKSTKTGSTCDMNSNVGHTLGSAPKNRFGFRNAEEIVHNNDPSTSMVECPICSGFFDSTKIQEHAASCNVLLSDSDSTDMENDDFPVKKKRIEEAMEECPVCGTFIISTSLEEHTTACVASAFPD